MERNITNSVLKEKHETRKKIETLLPVGKMYFDTYRHVRVDSKTIKLVKPTGKNPGRKKKGHEAKD